MGDHITTRFDSDRAYITLNRPGKHNGLTLEMLRDLVAAARKVAERKETRVVIVSGNGPSFSSGLDIAAATRDPLAIVREFLPRPWRGTNTFQEACWAWRRLDVPVIAAVHGRCFGGGLQLALAADFRIAAPTAEFSVMEAAHGLIPDMSGAVSLSQLIGIDQALLLTMTADPVDAAEARRIGLVTDLAEDPLAAAETLADRVAARDPRAVAAAKRLFDRSWQRNSRSTFAAERAAQVPLLLRKALNRS
ncbi:crotonase/enoyl-CoA hydratase family protein [Nocardia asteroides]|uniref:Enoyl-CoA hydratase n=1 Tax=Nocardia asteroides NBRC 15531 TaxID=1110697 RepID=U5EG34_NOCAS|nr:crotonase/enoyl-CoA hydratase family protein [Nocardia asteroides]TLF69315.1 crotonase/enoyl-CoA hydratase family protein [Nocardia asteroides NBRC 15531]UGT48807.1 crotonase/enoyl-CoA hydratase family protein [Nocardia asteroides]SFL71442.1 Enoyl-CoA hydratase/carnithine racemase [Nocardia asteroides]VEG31434.1 Probable enoyl-CoA hydratase echA8 [Nocardia asteroides]GAD85356.1 putative enoyl-CoA hydratase [Nocardia asteroides NBRC 15531]